MDANLLPTAGNIPETDVIPTDGRPAVPSALTTSQAQQQLDAWIAADAAVATGQSYTIGQRSLTRADVDQIRQQIQYWQATVDRLTQASYGRSPVLYSAWRQ